MKTSAASSNDQSKLLCTGSSRVLTQDSGRGTLFEGSRSPACTVPECDAPSTAAPHRTVMCGYASPSSSRNSGSHVNLALLPWDVEHPGRAILQKAQHEVDFHSAVRAMLRMKLIGCGRSLSSVSRMTATAKLA